MTFEILVSSVQKDARELVSQMNISSDAVIMSQGEKEDSSEVFMLGEKRITSLKSASKGVGLSRNTVFEHAAADVVLFADEDIVYENDYEAKVLKEFYDHQDADMILFNVKVCDERKTYWNTKYAPVKWYNCGRYPAYAIAARNGALKISGVKFSLLFGGGAKYSNGEDSLFLNDCLKAGMKIFASPVVIGEEIPRPSTWFFGYNDKFFYDRGVLYHFLYGKYAKLFGLRWLLKTKREFTADGYKYDDAKKMLFLGVSDGPSVEKNPDSVSREFEDGRYAR